MFALTEIVWQPWLRIYQANNKYRQLDYAIQLENAYKKRMAEEEEDEDDDEEDEDEDEENTEKEAENGDEENEEKDDKDDA